MIFIGYAFFDTTMSELIKDLLDIDVNKPEYSETCYGIENLETSKDQDEPYFVNINGQIGIYRDGFLLYWLTCAYSYSEENFKDTATVEIAEAFPENLQLFGMEVKNQARQ